MYSGLKDVLVSSTSSASSTSLRCSTSLRAACARTFRDLRNLQSNFLEWLLKHSLQIGKFLKQDANSIHQVFRFELLTLKLYIHSFGRPIEISLFLLQSIIVVLFSIISSLHLIHLIVDFLFNSFSLVSNIFISF